ncbi:calumenin-B-like isoform X1 [Branchiostoma floridae x Branchiostoma japonicum]
MGVRQRYLLVVLFVLTASAAAGRHAFTKELWSRMDGDGDSLVTKDELKTFLAGEEEKRLQAETERQWKVNRLGPRDKLTFAQYEKRVYKGEPDPAHLERVEKMKQEERRRFAASDKDQDGGLNKEEFRAFLYPREHAHMHDHLLQETLEGMDTDGDGALTYDEFTGGPHGMKPGSEARQLFKKSDEDGNELLSRDELKHYVLASVFGDEDSIVSTLDRNKDGKLSRSEVAAHPDVLTPLLYKGHGDVVHDEF